MRFTFLHPFT
uniref:Uncharacterized protein n=1 Tax=Rhizophora mucronata TaxID=61149 RepID=A0A2P2IJK9_RHIMU